MAPAPRPTTDDAPATDLGPISADTITPPAADAPTPAVPAAELEPDEPVRARWVDVQAVLADGRIIRYGDEILVSPEQLASPAHTTIPWSDDWTADPTLFAQSRKEG